MSFSNAITFRMEVFLLALLSNMFATCYSFLAGLWYLRRGTCASVEVKEQEEIAKRDPRKRVRHRCTHTRATTFARSFLFLEQSQPDKNVFFAIRHVSEFPCSIAFRFSNGKPIDRIVHARPITLEESTSLISSITLSRFWIIGICSSKFARR